MRVVVVVLLALASPARAEPTAPPEPKSPVTATALALTGTIVPLAVIGAGIGANDTRVMLGGMAGLMIAPSIGHWYAGEAFTTGMGIRIVGGGIAMLSFAYLIETDGESSAAGYLMLGGAGCAALGAVVDIVTAPGAVDAWNKKHVDVTVMKTGTGYGIGLVGRF